MKRLTALAAPTYPVVWDFDGLKHTAHYIRADGTAAQLTFWVNGGAPEGVELPQYLATALGVILTYEDLVVVRRMLPPDGDPKGTAHEGNTLRHVLDVFFELITPPDQYAYVLLRPDTLPDDWVKRVTDLLTRQLNCDPATTPHGTLYSFEEDPDEED